VLTVVVMARRADDPVTNPGRSNGRGPSTTAASKETPVADLRLDRLKTDAADLEAPTRNPFQFKQRAAPSAARPQASAAPPPVVVAPPPVAQGPPPPPPIALKYIGVLETAQGRVAIFRDTGGDIVNGREGDIIDGRYRLLKIGVESADLAYVDGRGRQTIRLSGQ
jgi:hypothetical protein